MPKPSKVLHFCSGTVGRCSGWSASLIVRDTSADVHVVIVDEDSADIGVGAVSDTVCDTA